MVPEKLARNTDFDNLCFHVLFLTEVPAQPLDLRILEVWSRKVSVIWAEPYSGNSPVTNYVIHYWRDKEGPHRLLEQPVGSTQTSAVIEELHPGTSYSMTITAENEVGPGAPSDAARFQTAEEGESSPYTASCIGSPQLKEKPSFKITVYKLSSRTLCSSFMAILPD